MAERIFNIQKFQSYWESLTKEQRSPDGREIVLTFAEEGTQMGLIDKEGNTVGMPWRFESDALGTNLLLQVLQHSGIPTGELEDYMIDANAEPEPEAEVEPDMATDGASADTEAQHEDAPYRVLGELEESTARIVGKTLLKTAAIVGTAYMAYLMCRRPSIGPVRFI